MHIMLASAHPYIPEIAGGAQSNMHEVALALRDSGLQVSVCAGLIASGRTGLIARFKLKVMRQHYVIDRWLGYDIYRAWFPWLVAREIAKAARPDVVIVQSGFPARMASAFTRLKIPVVVHFHNVEMEDLEEMNDEIADYFIANSAFTADFIKKTFQICAEPVLPSFFPEKYRVENVGQHVTFINPHPKKGVRLMLEIVGAMPEVTFLFVRAWSLSAEDEAVLAAATARFDNLTVHDAVEDMRMIYGQTRLLVMPSQWQEAWGRVATEAQFSGIPVVGSQRGGIPESIGPGGVLLPADAPVAEWVQTLLRLLHDKEAYAELSEAAVQYSKRAEIRIESQVAAIIRICQEAIAIAQARAATGN